MIMEVFCIGVKCSKKGWIDLGVMYKSGVCSMYCVWSEVLYLEKNESKIGNLLSWEILW